MIRLGVHTVTQQPRITATCDTDGCDQSMYLPDGIVMLDHAEKIVRGLGWQVERTDPYIVPTLTPSSSRATLISCLHETARKEARHGDPFAPDYADIQDGERVKAAREHRDHIGRDLKRARQQRDRALGKRGTK